MSDHMSLHDNSTNSVELPFVVADTDGAMVYIIIVILWYSMGIVFLLGMDILPRSLENEDLERRRERSMIRNSRNRTNTKEILEELVDKQKRDRLWDIYLGTMSHTKVGLTRAENTRIRLVKKKLASHQRNHQSKQDICPLSTNRLYYGRSRSHYRLETSKLASKLRHRSSCDQPTLD